MCAPDLMQNVRGVLHLGKNAPDAPGALHLGPEQQQRELELHGEIPNRALWRDQGQDSIQCGVGGLWAGGRLAE